MNDPTLSLPPDDDLGSVTVLAASDVPGSVTAPLSPPGFELLEEVGRGGMGVVYRARDLTLDREVALKFLRASYGPASAAAVRFVEEARITGQLQHPGIPAVYQVGTLDNGRPYLAMKLIRGATLDEILDDHSAPAADRGRFVAAFEQLCQAVAYAHAHDVIHRDLKPHNVMVGAFGEVQVMDWGLAKRIRNAEVGPPNFDLPHGRTAREEDLAACSGSATLTQHGSVLGSPAYMPPEQAVGDHDRIGPPADVFGLGAILCVVLTGKPPFAGENLEAIRVVAARGDTVAAFTRLDASGADPDLIALCKRCLAFEPADRPADADVVAKEVARIRAAADDRLKFAEMERAEAEVRATELRKRRKAVLIAAVGIVAVLFLGIIGTTVGLVRADRQRQEAEEAEAEARRLGVVAAARLDKAVEAVEKMLTRAGTSRWARDPSLAAERERVLADAVAFYEGFGEADDPVVRRETARAHRRIGSAYLLLGDSEKAADHLRRALRGAELLAAEFPDHLEYASTLAEIRLRLAASAAMSGRSEEAVGIYKEATANARRAVADGTAPDEARRTLVSCLIGSSFFTLQTDPTAGAALIQEAVVAIDLLLAAPKPSFATRALAAYTHASAATHDFNGGRQADGVAHVIRAQAILDATKPDPDVPGQYQDLFDLTSGLLAMTNGSLNVQTQPEKAAELYRHAAEKLAPLVAVYPKAFQYRFYQIMILHQETLVLTRLGRTVEAKARRAECLAAIAASRKHAKSIPSIVQVAATQRMFELLEVMQTGRVAELDRKVDAVIAEVGRSPAMSAARYNVACVLAQGSRYGTTEDRERRAARAVTLLSELLANDFYRGLTNATHVAADPDLDPLRHRTDFREFMAALRFKFPPPPEVAPPPRAVSSV